MKKNQADGKNSKLSNVQRKALLAAYAQGYSMVQDEEPSFGFKKATVEALRSAGLIEPDPEADEEGEFRATAKGREALGVRLEPKPRGLKAAIERSLLAIFSESIASEIEFDKEERVRKGGTLTLYPPVMRYNDLDEEIHWTAVQTMIVDLGWPVEMDWTTGNGTVLVTLLDE